MFSVRLERIFLELCQRRSRLCFLYRTGGVVSRCRLRLTLESVFLSHTNAQQSQRFPHTFFLSFKALNRMHLIIIIRSNTLKLYKICTFLLSPRSFGSGPCVSYSNRKCLRLHSQSFKQIPRLKNRHYLTLVCC